LYQFKKLNKNKINRKRPNKANKGDNKKKNKNSQLKLLFSSLKLNAIDKTLIDQFILYFRLY